MATEILFSAIQQYFGPLIEAAGFKIDQNGFIADVITGERLSYTNPKAQMDPTLPPIMYPCLPITDDHFVQIREEPSIEIFNPIKNIKHAALLVVKIKKVLIPYALSPRLVNSAHGEDELDALDEYLQVYNETDNQGYFEIGIVNTENEHDTKKVISFPADDPCHAAWGLCVLIYNNYVATNTKGPLPQFKNLDMSWRKLLRRNDEWDKAKKLVVAKNKEAQQMNQTITNDMIDFTDSSENDDWVPDLFVKQQEYVSNEDMNAFLMDIYKDQLTPYEEPVTTEEKPDIIKEESVVLNEYEANMAEAQDNLNRMMLKENENNGNLPFGYNIDNDIAQSSLIQTEEIPETKGILDSEFTSGKTMRASELLKENEEPKKFSLGSGVVLGANQTFQNNQNISQVNPMMNPMYGMQQPMMGMGYGMMNPMMGMNPQGFGLPTSNDDIDFTGNRFDPFSAYR